MSTPNTRRATRHQPTTRPPTATPLAGASLPSQQQQDHKAIQTLFRVLGVVDCLPPRNVFKYMRLRGHTERQTLAAAAVLGLPRNWHLSDSVDLDMVLASFHEEEARYRHRSRGVSRKL